MYVQITPVTNPKLKASIEVQEQFMLALGRFSSKITDEVIQTYATNTKYNDWKVAIRWDVLRAVGAQEKTCFITKMYNSDCNDSHIDSLLKHFINFKE